MFAERTVLVLGAGASIPYGFPSGQQLVDKLILDPDDPDIRQARNEVNISPSQFDKFRTRLRDSACISIDAFMGNRPDLAEIGRLLIAEQLLVAEKSALSVFSRPDTNWYRQLVDLIAPNKEAVSKNQLTIVTFNYDRSLEFYLHRSLVARFNWTDEEVRQALSGLKIIHVHGSLGKLQWQAGSDAPIPFGTGEQRVSSNAILYASKGIKVIHEAEDTTLEFEAAKDALQHARYVFILGFGYHPLNLARLGLHAPFKSLAESSSIKGTALGMSPEQVEHFKLKQPHIGLLNFDWDILQFMRRCKVFLAATDD